MPAATRYLFVKGAVTSHQLLKAEFLDHPAPARRAHCFTQTRVIEQLFDATGQGRRVARCWAAADPASITVASTTRAGGFKGFSRVGREVSKRNGT